MAGVSGGEGVRIEGEVTMKVKGQIHEVSDAGAGLEGDIGGGTVAVAGGGELKIDKIRSDLKNLYTWLILCTIQGS